MFDQLFSLLVRLQAVVRGILESLGCGKPGSRWPCGICYEPMLFYIGAGLGRRTSGV